VQLSLVCGDGGCGKTRLVKSFLDATTSKRRTTVLKGRSYDLAPLIGYQPFLEILRGALADEAEVAANALDSLPVEVLADLTRLVPELREMRPDLPAPSPLVGTEGRRRLFESVGRFLEAVCREGDPLILFLDDLHLADRDSLDLLEFLAQKLEGPIWIVAACRADGLDRDHPLARLLRQGEKSGVASRLEMDLLEPEAVEEIAEALVGEAETLELARFLEERSAGLPLALTESINFLWDEGILAARDAARWGLSGSLGEADLPADLDELIRIRVRRLPNSTRRLATLAAIMGQSFDVQLLQEAADEHVTVVEVGLEIMLRRWLIRQFAHQWTSTRRERDIVLWAQGARWGSFEFAHQRIRVAVYQELNPLRRQAMHAQVAEALERLRGTRDCEALAFHYSAAGQWEKALPHIERSIERCLSGMALDTARRYCDMAIEAFSRLAAGARSEAQADRWRDERERVREMREAAAL
jgi:predicted ATPase